MFCLGCRAQGHGRKEHNPTFDPDEGCLPVGVAILAEAALRLLRALRERNNVLHGGGWRSFMRYDQSKDRSQVSRHLLGRVLGYARPYWRSLSLMLVAICATALIGLVTPLLYRDLIDNVLPNRDFSRLSLLALGMIGIPVVSGLIDVGRRYLSARVGEGIIFDLRLGTPADRAHSTSRPTLWCQPSRTTCRFAPSNVE